MSKKARRPTGEGSLDYYFEGLREVAKQIRGERSSGLHRVAIAILGLAKAELSKQRGYAFVSSTALAEMTGLSRAQVERYVAQIIAMPSPFFVVERGGKHIANRYWPALAGTPIHKKWSPEQAERVEASHRRHAEWRKKFNATVKATKRYNQLCKECDPATFPGWDGPAEKPFSWAANFKTNTCEMIKRGDALTGADLICIWRHLIKSHAGRGIGKAAEALNAMDLAVILS